MSSVITWHCVHRKTFHVHATRCRTKTSAYCCGGSWEHKCGIPHSSGLPIISHFLVWPGIILGRGLANERRRYNVTSSPTGWAHTKNDPRGTINDSDWSMHGTNSESLPINQRSPALLPQAFTSPTTKQIVLWVHAQAAIYVEHDFHCHFKWTHIACSSIKIGNL